MADDSWDVPTFMEFQSTLPPIGMKDYVLEDLTPTQQSKLNQLLIVQKREDEMYLASHPEIRAIIALILRLVMKHRPKCNIHNFIAQYFMKPSGEIREEINNYLAERKLVLSSNSCLKLPVKEESDVPVEPCEIAVPSLETGLQGSMETMAGSFEKEFDILKAAEDDTKMFGSIETFQTFETFEIEDILGFNDPEFICKTVINDIINNIVTGKVKFNENGDNRSVQLSSVEINNWDIQKSY